MCTGCITAAEAVVIHGAAGVAYLNGGWTRLREHVTGTGSLERRRSAYEANAAFLAGMNLDPAKVLGPPPRATPGHPVPAAEHASRQLVVSWVAPAAARV